MCYRKLPNGDLVRKYGDLIEYLMAKDANIMAIEMDFEGKNVLLYHLGADHGGFTVPLRDPVLPRDLMCRGEATSSLWRAKSNTKHTSRCRCADGT